MRNRFTLIELLIVVAILGILASLLLPSLGKARYKSRIAVCMSNLKQCSVGMTAYSTGNDGRFSPVLPSFQSSPWTTYVLLENGQHYNMGKVYKDGFIPDPRVFFCPQNEENQQEQFTLEYNTNSNGEIVIPSGDDRARSSYHFLMKNIGYSLRSKIRMSQLDNEMSFLMDKLNHDVNTAHNQGKVGWNFMRPDLTVKFVRSPKVWSIVQAGPIGTKWSETTTAINELLTK
ncbi:MAG: prepilin-type N-terminal cleavage/methylation domain-containing protein [Lentisphaeraceae bacterium]|nr:prepilin-type N-terminal cleavage/methylation domain-containing protein [Lentisphaeraceae bacterium]